MADTESKIRLTLIDNVSASMQKIGGMTEDLSREFSEGLVKGVGDAIGGFDKFQNETGNTSGKLSGLRGAIEGVGNKLASFGNHLKQAFMNGIVLKGLDMVAQGLNKIKDAMIGGNAEFERYEVQFGVLLGSTAEAKKRLADLAEFGAKTPFELPEVVRADKILQGFGLHSKDTAKRFGMSGEQIRTVAGDVAAGTGASFEEIAGYIGKFSAGSTGEAISRFQELGITTRKELAEMGLKFSKSGELISPLDKSMDVLLAAMKKKFGGMMDAQSGTFEGMMSNLQDWFGQAGRLIGAPIFDVLKENLAGLLSFLGSDQAKGAMTAFATGIAGGIKTVLSYVQPLIQGFQALFAGGYQAGTGIFTIVSTLAKAFGYSSTEASAFGMKAMEAFSTIRAKVGEVVAWFIANWPQIKATAISVFTAVSGFIQSTVIPAISKIVEVATGLVTAIIDNWPQIKATAIEVFTAVSGFIQTYVIPAITKIVEVAGEVVKAIVDNWPQIQATAASVFASISDFYYTYVAPVLGFFLAIATDVFNFIVDRWPQISEVLRTVGGYIEKAFTAKVKEMSDLVSRAIPEMKAVFAFVFPLIKATIKAGVEAWKALVGDALDILTNKTGNKLEQVSTFFREKFEAVKTYLGGLGSALWKLGENAIIGLINGIKSKIAPLIQAFEKVATDPVQAFRDMMGIHSPSTVMFQAGQDTMQGLIDGMGGMRADAVAVMSSLSTGLETAMRVTPPDYDNVVAALDAHERHAIATTSSIAQQYDNVVAELDAHERHAAAVLYGEMQKTAAASAAIAAQTATAATASGTGTLTSGGQGINQTFHLTFQVGDDTLATKVIEIINGVLQAENARYGTA